MWRWKLRMILAKEEGEAYAEGKEGGDCEEHGVRV